MKDVNVLFVCMGNICRSPTAEGVFRHLVKKAKLQDRIHIDSAGTHAYHVGEQPDLRSQTTAIKRGVDLSTQRARQVQKEDFHRFDYILAMDWDNYRNLMDIAPMSSTAQIRRFMEYSDAGFGEEVPDPYYGGPLGFEKVLDMVENAAKGLLNQIKQTL